MSKRVNKWRNGKKELARLKKQQESHVKIVVTMRVQMDNSKRPICLGCDHSVMSHGERDGKLFCWACESQNKQCKEAMTIPELREINYQLGGTTLNQFQKDAFGTAVYPGQGTVRGVEYTLFGALGEVGELANKYKKILRNEADVYAYRELLMDEAMDGVWYLMALLKELGYTFQEGGDFNLAKLAGRKASGTLKEHK